MSERWTAEMVRTPEGMRVYAEQLRMNVQELAEEVRRMRLEVHADVKHDPPEGCGAVATWGYANWMARTYDDLEYHMRQAEALTRELERKRRTLTELPARKAEKKLEKRGKTAIPAGQGTSVPAQAGSRKFDLFDQEAM
ncbi:hypothetical protein ACFPA8_27625 [Streptomyces ovatisporus]|uniref:PE-PGRS family protein n=1 Tax=Streptomyces ovatisporus TaxID=1128682 RepID=A0ABV9ADD2_9ACTN